MIRQFRKRKRVSLQHVVRFEKDPLYTSQTNVFLRNICKKIGLTVYIERHIR